MNSKMTLSIAVSFFLIFLTACKGQISQQEIRDFNNTQSNTFVKDISAEKNWPTYSKMKQDVEDRIGIGSIENGFDEIQIRVWIGYTQNDTLDLIIFKRSNAAWSGKFNQIIFRYDEKNDTLLVDGNKSWDKQPASGWESFMNKLLGLNILNLPDYQTLPNYHLPTDAAAVTVEVGTSKKYRVYFYPSLDLYKDKIPEANQMEKILQMIEKEFGFKRLKEM